MQEKINLKHTFYDIIKNGGSMKEFISLLISFVLMGFADNVDSFFNNAISINAIVVCGCLFTINLILNAICQLGIAAYRTVRKNEWAYLLVNIISSLIIGIIIFLTKDYIVNIFELTNYQKQLLSNVLSIYIFYIVIGRTSNAIFEMVRLKGNIKLYNKSLLLFYICLIALDALAFILTKNLVLLFVATITSWAISIIYMLYHLKLKFMLPHKEDINNVLKYGFPILIERLIMSVYLLIYTLLASHLGTEMYAIHVICFAVAIKLEIITDAYQASQMINVPLNENYDKQYQVLTELKKQCSKIIIIANYVLCILYLVISHGSLPIEKCFPYIIFYSFSVFALLPYETYKTLCVCQGKSKFLVINAFIAVCIAIIPCILFLHTKYALIAFGLSITLEYFIKLIILKYLMNKEFNKPKDIA
ncbi:MAG: hypothetical protein HFH45_02830 [Bacilli bacterium]|nr:hypothetical protein [Bacilli bacterium]